MDMVTVTVDGRPVQVPARTSASEIRRMSRSEQSRPLVKVSHGRNVVVSGEFDVADGDSFIAGKPFTKGQVYYAKVQGAILQKAAEGR